MSTACADSAVQPKTAPTPERYVVVTETLSDQVRRYFLNDASSGASLPWRTVVQLWRTDSSFALFFTAALAAAPFDSFFWECPPVTVATLDQPFEFVVVRAGGFSRANPSDFAEHFGDEPGASTFQNLGGDATLVAPTGEPVLGPGERRAAFGHLAVFCRSAPETQHVAVWQAVGAAMHALTSIPEGRPVWLNTEGSGVPWVHVRLDSRPKYYHHRPFKQAA